MGEEYWKEQEKTNSSSGYSMVIDSTLKCFNCIIKYIMTNYMMITLEPHEHFPVRSPRVEIHLMLGGKAQQKLRFRGKFPPSSHSHPNSLNLSFFHPFPISLYLFSSSCFYQLSSFISHYSTHLFSIIWTADYTNNASQRPSGRPRGPWARGIYRGPTVW